MENKELALAWKFIEDTDVSVFLTGKAGTGKTTFLRKVKEEMPKRMVVVAPTGVAAINANGVTMHSFFQLPIGIHVPGQVEKERHNYFTMSKEKKNILRTLDLLIIDEISMVRCDLLDAVDQVLRKYKDRYKPFGGVQLLMIGDLQQLAPVANEQEWSVLRDYYDTPYFFSSKALQQTPYITIELQKIYRQEDDHFISLLSNIREGRLDQTTVASLNQRYIPGFTIPADSDYILLTTHNYRAQQYNQQQLDSLDSTPHRFCCQVSGTFPETSYPADSELVLKVGAQVMYIKNDSSVPARYYNGKIGKVMGFNANGILVQSVGENTMVNVEPAVWENTEYEIDPETKEIREHVVGNFTQYPLRLAWSITIHKSQGLTFDHAVLDINQSFAHGQVYVALSRCRTLEGLVLSNRLYTKSLHQDEQVSEYIHRELASAPQSYSRLEEYRFRYHQRLLDEQFDFLPLQSYVGDMSRLFHEYLYKNYPVLCQEWESAEKEVKEKMSDVALKFKSQYIQLLAENGNDLTNAHLQERIHKAADYFFKNLCDLLAELHTESKDIAIVNKQVKKRYDNAYDRFSLEYNLKVHTLLGLTRHPFTASDYLHDKSRALIPDADLKKGSSRRKSGTSQSSKPKRQKGETYTETLRLFRSGKTYNEIAEERFLTPGTIFSHLMRFVADNTLELHEVLIPSHIEFVKSLFEQHGQPERISDYLKLLPKEICSSEYYKIAYLLGYKDKE